MAEHKRYVPVQRAGGEAIVAEPEVLCVPSEFCANR
jgi:hypothetical protein